MDALLAPPPGPAAPPAAELWADDPAPVSATPTPNRPLTEAEYLHLERTASDGPRCEFDGTHRLPMSGSTRRHVNIAKAVERSLDDLIGDRPFETYRSDLRMRVPSGRYRYPDVMLTPSPPRMLDDEHDVVLNPIVVIEVSSDSTAHTDRGAKLREYRSIPSLTDYLLLAQDGPVADHYVRVGGGAARPDEPDAWRLITYEGPAAAVPLDGLGELRLGAIYGTGT